MKNRYNITFSQSDKLIVAWKRKVIAANQEEMTTLVKNAILEFIDKETFSDIGHIHFHPEQETVKKYDGFILQTARTPIISHWIEANKEAGLGVSEPIKLLLKQCIKVVPDNEPEYFPPKNNLKQKQDASNILETMRRTANKVSGKHANFIPIQQQTQTVTPEVIITPSNTQNESVNEKPTSFVEKKEINQTPKVNTAENPQVINGLYSLLPKVGGKKKSTN